jgi:DNA-binding MarR family transcriptional regulator
MKTLHNEADIRTARSLTMQGLWTLTILLGEGMQGGLAERGLTVARATLLWQLQLAGPSTQNSLSLALRVTPRNITGLVDALEADGLVARNPHPSDRRATVVSLTDEGSSMVRAMGRDQDRFAQELFGDVAAAELETFNKVLDQVVTQVRHSLKLDEYDLAAGASEPSTRLTHKPTSSSAMSESPAKRSDHQPGNRRWER